MRDVENTQQGPGNSAQDELEVLLVRTMHQVAAPVGFADRLMARAAQETFSSTKAVKPGWWNMAAHTRTHTRTWLGGAVAAVLAIGVFAGEQQYRHHQRERVANREFEAATRITDKALAHTRDQLARAGVSLE